MNYTQLEQVLRKFPDAKLNGHGYQARCPAHGDDTPSLSIAQGDKGGVVLHCHAGCTAEAVVRAVGLKMSDLMPSRNGKAKIYDYKDESGEVLFQVCRYEPKDFKQRKPNGKGGWTWNLTGVRPVLYRLPELLAETARTVVVVEGEKDVDNLRAIGVPATCNAGGAGKWKDEFSETLRGKRVVVLPDNDEPGRNHAQQVAHSLQGVAEWVRIVELPGLAEKGDVSDWLDAGGTSQQLLALAKETPEWKPSATDAAGAPDPHTDEPVEAVDDPHRLARQFIAEKCSNPAGERTLVFYRDEFHRHNGVFYRVVPTSEVKAHLTKFVKSEFDAENRENDDAPPKCRKVTTTLITNVMQALQGINLVGGLRSQPFWLNGEGGVNPAEVLATRSGLLVLPRIGEADHLLKPTANFFSPNGVGYDFDSEAKCPQWEAFLNSIFANDEASIQTLQEWMGYLLLPETRLHKILMLIGPPRSGKGTIGRVIKRLIGEGNLACPTLGSLAGPFGLWGLLGKTTALVADARLSGRMDAIAVVERLLSISGEDPQDVHRKNLPTLTGIRLPVRFMLLTNELPNMRDASGALASRMIILRLTESFLGREDLGLDDRLAAELPGILNWALAGWKRVRQQGAISQPETGRELLADMDDLSSPIKHFLRECCDTGKQFNVRVDELFGTWKNWCERNGREYTGTTGSFGKDLRAALPNLSDSKRRSDGDRFRVYNGVRVKPD